MSLISYKIIIFIYKLKKHEENSSRTMLAEQHILIKSELNGEAFSFEPIDRLIQENRWICGEFHWDNGNDFKSYLAFRERNE